jgi:hypothetical protein
MERPRPGLANQPGRPVERPEPVSPDPNRPSAARPVPVPVAEILVTPALAQAWLEAVPNGGPPDEERVAQIAADIAAGRWDGSRGGPASLGMNGHLDRGWHRCLAIVATGQAAVMRVQGLHSCAEQAAAGEQLRVARS